MPYETSALRSPHLTPGSSEIGCAWWGLIWPRGQGQVILQGPVAKEGQEKAAPVVEHSRGRVREIWIMRQALHFFFPSPGGRGKRVIWLKGSLL